MHRRRDRSAAWAALAVIGLVAVALNQRTAVASIGPVLDQLRRAVPLGSTAAAVLTAAPVVCFGAFAAAGDLLSRRFGMRGAVALLAVALTGGLVLRLGPDAATLFAGTVLAAAAIAAMNVILPAFIRLRWPARTGLMMGVYTTVLTGAAAAAAGVTVPLEHLIGGGWRSALAPWAVLGGLGAVLWLPLLREPSPGVSPAEAPAVTASSDSVAGGALWRDRIAWLVTGYFGLQSAAFYSVLTWLPTLFTDHGLSATKAGALLSLSTLVQTPVALVTPQIAARMKRQGPLVALSVACAVAGYLLLIVAPVGSSYAAMVLIGIGLGASFPLSLTILVLRAPTAESVTRLSSMAQTVGYLFAALGPLLVGLLHSATGGWLVPLLLLTAFMGPQLICGVLAGRPRTKA